jgi:hypothetical protein
MAIADPWGQLEQWGQCRAGRPEREQRPLECEQQHRLSASSPPIAKNSASNGGLIVQGEKELYPFFTVNRR